MKETLQILPYKKYSHIKRIGNIATSKCLYKYLSLSTFKKCLTKNCLLFRRPTVWNDPFEKRFYDANYENVKCAEKVNKEFYACCVTHNRSCEAAWRMYSDNYMKDPCIQICLSIGQIRTFLNDYAGKHGAIIYEGNINYDFTDKEISTLHLRANDFHKLYFENFTLEKYLNLMLIKRSAFKYEGEVRYFMFNGKHNDINGSISVDIPWSLCMTYIKLSSEFKENDIKQVNDILKANYALCKEQYPNRYPQIPNVIPNDLLNSFGRITIE